MEGEQRGRIERGDEEVAGEWWRHGEEDKHRDKKQPRTNFSSIKTTFHRSTSVLLKDNEKRRREEETRRGSCPRMGTYAVRGIVSYAFR